MKKISLTFDDGLLNTYEVAYPILRELGVKATLFVVSGVFTGEVGTEQIRPADKSPLMNVEQVRELANAGWEIGSHSHTHRVFNTLGHAQVENELVHSRNLLRFKYGFDVTSFAFPAGHKQYHPEDVWLAAKYYRWVRDVGDPSIVPEHAFISGYPVDDYPVGLDFNTSGLYVTVHHRILQPALFRGWVEGLLKQNWQFTRLRDMV